MALDIHRSTLRRDLAWQSINDTKFEKWILDSLYRKVFELYFFI